MLDKFRSDSRGKLDGSEIMGLVVGGAFAVYAFAYVAVPAITEIFTADTSSWNQGAADVLPLIAIFLILGVALYFAKPALEGL